MMSLSLSWMLLLALLLSLQSVVSFALVVDIGIAATVEANFLLSKVISNVVELLV